MNALRALKIAHIDIGLSLRGGQRQLLRLARGLRQRGHAQIIVCRDESELEACVRMEEFPCFPLPLHDPLHAHGILQLRQLLQVAPCDILHAHDGHGQTAAWLATAGMRIRRVATRRVAFLPRERHRWTYRLKYAHTCDAVIAVSDSVRQAAIRYGIPQSKIELIPDGIEIPPELPSSEARAQARARWGFGESEFLIGHLGAFTPEKGQDVALGAFQLLSERLPQARLLLAGEGPTLRDAEITQRCAALGGRVRLCGAIQNLAEFFPALDLFVMPSKSEGLGSSALIAMSYGLPVVASRVGGLPEVVEEARTGWLIEPASPAALARAILAAAGDRGRLQQWGLNGRERARQFSVDIMVERTEALYRRLLLG
jgi:glycosyltransferase involved in cell wall biosynthesis